MGLLWWRRGGSGRSFKAVAMDIDGTLTDCDTLGLTSERLGLPVPELASINKGYLQGTLTHEQTRELVLSRWRSSGKADRSQMESIFRSMPLRNDVFRLIRRIKERSLHSCLITSSMDFYAQVMAKRLGVTDYYANVLLTFDEGDGALSGMEFSKDAALLKQEQLMNFCTAKGISPEDVLVLGNAHNDRAMFEVTGNGVLIGGDDDEDLASSAWRTVGSLAEVVDLL